ncbi:hypothetical protein SLE2022_207040 [Rubroshorea leprosula]
MEQSVCENAFITSKLLSLNCKRRNELASQCDVTDLELEVRTIAELLTLTVFVEMPEREFFHSNSHHAPLEITNQDTRTSD